MKFEILPLDESKLFSTTIYSDGIAGQLHVQEPYNFDGQRVLSRETKYLGFTQIQTTAGPVGVQFAIPADSLRSAFSQWPALARAACEKVISDMQSHALRQSILAPGKKGQ